MDQLLDIDCDSEAAAIEADDDAENFKCGICMDIVIDRGVLDCCQHWFCFACIDNWSTITNLCPFCKKEFQLITCLPVYDTIGNTNSEENLFSRDEEWCIQGKNNALSFPSYYINEDAVICLDDDDCKIRSGFSTSEDELNADTSIACDSCDIWYHAVCVGFDSHSTGESSWLCPRCVTDRGAQKLDGLFKQNIGSHSELNTADLEWPTDSTFSGKVSVAVADTGDTDIVISMVDGRQRTHASERFQSGTSPDANPDKETGIIMLNIGANNMGNDVQVNNSGRVEFVPGSSNCNDEIKSNAHASGFHSSSEVSLVISPEIAVSPLDNLKEDLLVMPSTQVSLADMDMAKPADQPMETTVELPVSQNVSKSFNQEICDDWSSKITDETKNCDVYRVSNPCSIETSGTEKNMSGIISLSNLHPDQPVASSLSIDLAKDNMLYGTCENSEDLGDAGSRELVESLYDSLDVDFGNKQCSKREREMEGKMDTEHPLKKPRSMVKFDLLHLENNDSALDHTKRTFKCSAVSVDDNSKHGAEKYCKASDIMSIIQEKDHRSSNALAGLRVKKIVRRDGEKNESSVLIQKLRAEIREAVQNNTCNIKGKENVLNGELLTAFRTALAKPESELVNKSDLLRVRKSSLQKGKVRDSLTKKIYATSTGRRRKAWDRDCEVEFWKHRCIRSNPEKVETLQSVLELLKKASSSGLESPEKGQDPEKETKDSILSRVYLADVSVFPRKDDIKPLSALEGCSQNKTDGNNFNNIATQESQLVHKHNVINNPTAISKGGSNGKVSSGDSEGKKLSSLSSNREAPCQKGKLNGSRTGGNSKSGLSSSKEGLQNSKEPPNLSDLATTGKRKWALEVLARKSSLTNADASKQNQEDRSALKGNYLLLAQLPVDMIPVVTPCCHNKVPLSVRQAQLHRIAEHYLKRTNIVPIRRMAVTELAIADAINVEREISERSNSKLVYVNLCSQVLSQHKTKSETSENILPTTITSSEDIDQTATEKSTNSAATCSNVEEALKLAGLADSPPNSPCIVDSLEEEDLKFTVDADSCPDFEIGMDDASCRISSRTMDVEKLSEGQAEEDNSSTKVVLPKLNYVNSDSENAAHDCHNSDQNQVANDSHNMKDVEAPSNSSTILECESDRDNRKLEGCTDIPSLLEPSRESNNGTLAEGRELHAVDRELPGIINEVGETSKVMKVDAAVRLATPGGTSNHKSEKETKKFVAGRVVGNNLTHDRVPCRGKHSVVHSVKNQNVPMEVDAAVQLTAPGETSNHELKKETRHFLGERIAVNSLTDDRVTPGDEHSAIHSVKNEHVLMEGTTTFDSNSDSAKSISKKVEAYVKEHIRPLCKSGVISVEQYRWAVAKTTEKVMKFHHKAKSASFLIKEGAKVKKLAEDYVEASQKMEWA